jgi:hypothetical protein
MNSHGKKICGGETNIKQLFLHVRAFFYSPGIYTAARTNHRTLAARIVHHCCRRCTRGVHVRMSSGPVNLPPKSTNLHTKVVHAPRPTTHPFMSPPCRVALRFVELA